MLEIKVSCTISIPEGPITFKTLERELFGACRELFVNLLGRLLEALDQQLRESRDLQRYELRGVHKRDVETFLGTVQFKRRYYRDHEAGEYVYLLDRLLCLPRRVRIGPWLKEMVLSWAVEGRSYRSAVKRLEQLVEAKLLSHESLRQLVLQLGRTLSGSDRRRASDPEGSCERRVILIEADGLHVPLQRCGKRRRRVEPKVGLIYEGWQPRHQGLAGNRLVKRQTVTSCGSGEEFWELLSRLVYHRYRVDQDTLVVISGDGASWIRQGVEYFPRAIYQYSRYHLARELRRLLKERHEQLYVRARQAFRSGESEEIAAALWRAAEQERDLKHRTELLCYHGFVLEHLESCQEYRVQLERLGVAVEGLQGVGGIEGTIRQFAKRMKGGRSWSLPGLAAMMRSRASYIDGTLSAELAGSGILTAAAVDLQPPEQLPRRRRARSGSGSAPQRIQLPATYGPHQDRGWVKALRAMTSIYFDI